MAVFTTFSKKQLRNYLVMYGLGELKAFRPIPEGAENSNYFVTLKSASGIETEYVLTVFEAHDFNEVPFFTKLIQHLHHYGLPVATPLATLDGMTTGIFCSKPTVLFPRLPGAHVLTPSTDQCHAIGSVLAELHTTGLPRTVSQTYQYDLAWFTRSGKQLARHFERSDVKLLNSVIEEYTATLAHHESSLEKCIIHGDLFKDNVLFQDNQITGLIDFYHGGIGIPLLDLAITINDWCHDEQQKYLPGMYNSLVEGYQSIRPLTQLELELLPVFLRVAATKFWIRRAELAVTGNQRKDPGEYRTILHQWRETGNTL